MELRSLEIDGETPYELEKVPLCLSVAEALLSALVTLPEGDLASDLRVFTLWWEARCGVAHHRCLLGNPSPSLRSRVHDNFAVIEEE